MIKKPKAMLFDWDNTLINTWDIIHSAMNATLKGMGEETWSMEYAKENISKSMREAFPEKFGDKWEDAAQIFRTHQKANARNFSINDNAEELLKLIQEKNIYCAIVSNKGKQSLAEDIEYLGWNKYFHKIIGSGDAEYDKPSIEPAIMGLELLEYNKIDHDIWFVGDTITDMECAYNAGCYAILYGEADPYSPKFANASPHMHIKNHKELINML